jgi:hypothetical protein
MTGAGFALLSQPGGHVEPGIWMASTEVAGEQFTVPIDLIVPEGVAPSGGRRGARLGVHGNRAARRATGLEAALIDDEMTLASLEPGDGRAVVTNVAGTAALFVAKLYKVHDRSATGRTDRLNDKDAADLIRLMRADPASVVGTRLGELATNPIAGAATVDSLTYLDELIGKISTIRSCSCEQVRRVAVILTAIALAESLSAYGV